MQSVAQTEPFYLFQKLKKDLTDSPIFDILQLMTVLGTSEIGKSNTSGQLFHCCDSYIAQTKSLCIWRDPVCLQMSPNLKIVLAVLLSLFVCEAFSLRSRMQMSTVAVFGGTGKTGAEVVYQALKAGNKVIVLARDPAKMQIPAGSGGVSNEGRPLINDNLQIIQGSVTDANDVEKVFAAADLDVDGVSGVVVALGGKTKDVGKTMLYVSDL
jgi:hypothetical protein